MTRAQRRHRVHVPQRRAAAPGHARRAAHRRCSSTARRSSTPCPTSATTTAAPEKMGERQTWHTYIPYTDRVDYLGGVMNNLAYVLAVEKLAGIEVPDRAKVIRVMMSELFRIASHLVWYGTFAQDVGRDVAGVLHVHRPRDASSTSSRRSAAAACTRAGSASAAWPQDLPDGLGRLVRDFLDYLPPRLDEYDTTVMRNRIFKARTKGVGAYTPRRGDRVGRHRAGPARLRLRVGLPQEAALLRLRALRVRRSDRPTRGDCYDRAVVRVEEMRQSLRIIEQCVDNMPAGPTRPSTRWPRRRRKERTHARHRDADHALPAVSAGAR